MALSITGEGAIFAEREPLYELVYNLIENAAKYGKEGGHIQVNVEETSDEVRLSVRDDGPGIAPEHLPRIFERFYRTDRSRNRKSQSTGLGLAIVKHTAQRYHGTVRAESELGKYTEFTVIFPKQ